MSIRHFLFSILGIFFSLCTQVTAEEVIRIGGAGANLGTIKLIGEAFEKSHPGIKVLVLPSLGSAGGIMALSKGGLDVALSARPLRPEENTGGIAVVEYARTPFVFIAHKKVSKNGLTARELEDIYLGRTKNWPDGGRIRLVLRPEIDSNTKNVKSISPSIAKALDFARLSKPLLAVTDQDCTDAVAKIPGSLGTSTFTQFITEKKPLKVLAFDGVVPSVKSLSDGTYRLSTTHYLATNSGSRPAARQFVDFVLSSEGSKILTRSGNLLVGVSNEK